MLIDNSEYECFVIEVFQLAVFFLEIAVEGELFFKLVCFIEVVHDLFESPVLDLQAGDIVSVDFGHLGNVLLADFLLSNHTLVVTQRKLAQSLLVVQIRLLQLMFRVTAPVHSLLVHRNVHQILVELHHHHLVVIGKLIKKRRHLAPPLTRCLLPQLVLKPTSFNQLE